MSDTKSETNILQWVVIAAIGYFVWQSNFAKIDPKPEPINPSNPISKVMVGPKAKQDCKDFALWSRGFADIIEADTRKITKQEQIPEYLGDLAYAFTVTKQDRKYPGFAALVATYFDEPTEAPQTPGDLTADSKKLVVASLRKMASEFEGAAK